MTRPPSDRHEQDAQGPTKPPSSAAPTWRPHKKAEVATFIIPELPIPWDSVIDVRSATRLQIAGFDPPLFVPLPPLQDSLTAPAAHTSVIELLPLPTEDRGVSEVMLNADIPGVPMASGLDLALPASDDHNVIEASSFEVLPLAPPDREAPERPWAAVSAVAAGFALGLWAKGGHGAGIARARMLQWRRDVAARSGAMVAGLSRATAATRASAAAAWPRVQAGRKRVAAQISNRVAVWRPRLGLVATACAANTIRVAAGVRASLSLLPAVIAGAAVRNRRQLRLTALATASVLLVFGAALLLQRLIPLADVNRSTEVTATLAATPLAGAAALAPAILERTATIVPDVRDEPVQTPVARIQPPPRPAALVPRRAAVTASAASSPPPTNDAVRADLSSAPLERPRALVPAPFPTPREDAARASRTDEARIDESLPPAERTGDRPVPAPFPTPRSDAPRADRTDLAANDGIAEALKHLELAYGRRDATLAKAVWPTVNERALARAFDGLRSQSVTFDRCKMDVAGAAGEVECHGITTYVTRVGSQDRRTESRQWKFRVKKADDSWLIVSAAAR